MGFIAYDHWSRTSTFFNGSKKINLNKNKMQKIIISAPRFLDLLMSAAPAACKVGGDRPYLESVKFEIDASKKIIKSISTNGHLLSYCERELGFSNKQTGIEDIGCEIFNTQWLMKIFDVELLIVALKKLKIKRSFKDDSENPSYIVLQEIISENKQSIEISILGESNIILDPQLLDIDSYPEYKKVVPRNETKCSSLSFPVDIKLLDLLRKCWGDKRIIINFYNDGSITKIMPYTTDYDGNDFIVLMPLAKNKELEEQLDERQSNFFNN